jgi:hypothetical protein
LKAGALKIEVGKCGAARGKRKKGGPEVVDEAR